MPNKIILIKAIILLLNENIKKYNKKKTSENFIPNKINWINENYIDNNNESDIIEP